MSAIELPRIEERKSYINKPSIGPSPAWGYDSGGTLFIRCACGLCMNLDDAHKIDSDGNVSPSIHHDEPECGWHVFARLLDYTEKSQ